MEIQVYNHQGQEADTMELPAVFALPWNADLVHQTVTAQAANLRSSVAHVKDRGAVRGGGRKPWRQKGTGRARHGSIRSPIWRGGGVTHGPTKERSFKKKINRKMAAKALAAVLSAKIRDRELIVLDELTLPQPKTKAAATFLQNFGRARAHGDLAHGSRRALVLLPAHDAALRRAFRNLAMAEVAEAKNVTALDVLSRKYVLVSKAGMAILAKRLQPSP